MVMFIICKNIQMPWFGLFPHSNENVTFFLKLKQTPSKQIEIVWKKLDKRFQISKILNPFICLFIYLFQQQQNSYWYAWCVRKWRKSVILFAFWNWILNSYPAGFVYSHHKKKQIHLQPFYYGNEWKRKAIVLSACE